MNVRHATRERLAALTAKMLSITAVGWLLSTSGFATLIWAWFFEGTPALVDWSDYLPTWLAPTNLEGEIGFVVALIGDVLLCWQQLRRL